MTFPALLCPLGAVKGHLDTLWIVPPQTMVVPAWDNMALWRTTQIRDEEFQITSKGPVPPKNRFTGISRLLGLILWVAKLVLWPNIGPHTCSVQSSDRATDRMLGPWWSTLSLQNQLGKLLTMTTTRHGLTRIMPYNLIIT